MGYLVRVWVNRMPKCVSMCTKKNLRFCTHYDLPNHEALRCSLLAPITIQKTTPSLALDA
jgi:hypothetical protein